MLSRLFIAALWSPAGKGLNYWLLFVMFNCVSVSFPCGIQGQVWYLIVSIPDLCRLSYFNHFKPKGISDSYQLSQSIFVVSDVWYVSFNSNFNRILCKQTVYTLISGV